MWKSCNGIFPVEMCRKTSLSAVDKFSFIGKLLTRFSTKVFPTATVTKKRLVYVLFCKNMHEVLRKDLKRYAAIFL